MQEIFLDKNLLGKFPNKSRALENVGQKVYEKQIYQVAPPICIFLQADMSPDVSIRNKTIRKGEFIWKIHQNISISIRERSSNFSFLLFFCSFFGGKSNSFSTLSFLVYWRKNNRRKVSPFVVYNNTFFCCSLLFLIWWKNICFVYFLFFKISIKILN